MFACLFIPDFSVEAVVRAEPELRDHAVAVLEGTPPVLQVVGTNERARQAGIEIGMTKLQAEGRLPSLAMRRRSSLAEAAAHAALLDCACAFSPRVEDDPAAPDMVVLDLSGLERLFGPLPKIARDLSRRASELGLEINVAVASNPDAATYAARGFTGVTVIPPGKEAERLGSLPVELFGERDMLDTLDRWGVRTFRSLAALPETAVRERLGEAGVRWQCLARGVVSRPLVPAEPPLLFEEAAELEHPVALLEPLAFVLNRMLEQLCARLSARALSTSELRLRLGPERPAQGHRDTEQRSCRGFTRMDADQSQGVQTFEVTLRLPVPMLDAKVFLKLLQLELRSRPPGAPVEKIFLAAEPVQPRFTQGGLFAPATPQPEKLEVTLARIRRVVGRELRVASKSPSDTGSEKREQENATDNWQLTTENCLGTPELVDTHWPDAFRMKKFVPRVASSELRVASQEQRAVSEQNASWMSLRRFRPPLPVRVDLSQDRPVRIGPNSQLATDNSQLTGNCVWAAGPWIDSGDWWTGYPWSHEVWDVALEPGGFYRIYRDTITNAWFMEAMYD